MFANVTFTYMRAKMNINLHECKKSFNLPREPNNCNVCNNRITWWS